ncbi:C6 transcription factor [Aspergillus eucalypticola CBS 122712]|uniref:C6 transcription factor n=1 Tax=Aspergillus eucalypticola (strain CBS 122712 / IBT 29274) TaxID=1448314 RepID=A0A317W7Z3_ASPEC|nr:C6 transcription factor [Aspergillus eucalypticola CBS 122712]PWY82503.1 C6 transcription factor [Aspergillus eucalypticola CBS 122712]
MPRKKAADRVGPVKTRSRSGCKECRASRVRCDLKKPICTRCLEKGLVCSTQLVLKWESEFVSRGLAFGRAGVWSKARAAGGLPPPPGKSSAAFLLRDQEWCPIPLIESWGFVNSGVSTFEQPYEVNVACDELNALVVRDKGKSPALDDLLDENADWSLSPSSLSSPSSIRELSDYCSPVPLVSPHLAPPLSMFPSLSDSNQGRLFDYYLQQVCPRTTASSKLSSPFASIILPFCMSASPILFKAIQALGACHWSRFDSTYSVIGLRLKSEALRGLRYRLSTEGSLLCSADPEVLAIMMMLCLYEIVDNCDQRWTIHLKGAKELIRIRRQKQQLTPSRPRQSLDPVSAFAELFFAFQDVMGRTACGEEVLFGTDYWQENNRHIDLWMGCSPELVSILSSITELSRTRRQLASEAARKAFSQRAASLGRRLENLVQETTEDDDNNDDGSLRSAAELKRLAAVLYLHCALYGASPSTPLVISYVRRILRLVSHLLDSGSLVSMTWPVFVAAVELDPLHDEVWRDDIGKSVVYGRPLVLRALAAMAESSVSNVARTRAVIVKIWQARDSDMLKGSPVDAADDSVAGCNDWEWYVAPISTAMSLA